LFPISIGINSTASYFGDFHLTPEDIDTIVEVVFEKEDDEISHGGKYSKRIKNDIHAHAYTHAHAHTHTL
jgi:hypothetical protein